MDKQTWQDVRSIAAQLEVIYEQTENGYIMLKKHQGVSGMFQESEAGLAAALAWLVKLQTMMGIADKFRK